MSKYQVKKGEEGYIHLEIQRKEFDSKTGKPLFKPTIHIVTPRDFKLFLEHPHGMTINKFLHVPEGYEIPKRKIKDDEGNSKMVEYPVLKGVKLPSAKSSNSPEELRKKELGKMKVEDIDAILDTLEIENSGNKSEKIDAILKAESQASN